MRRVPISLAATAALLPVVLCVTAEPASAAGTSLTVNAIGRNGAKAPAQVQAWNLDQNHPYTLTVGKTLSVPKGRYSVMADVESTSPTSTDTLGAVVINVTGRNSVTFDARKGKAIRASVDAATGAAYQESIDARVCTASGFPQMEAWNSAGSVFVIPSTDKDLSFAYLANFQGPKQYVVSAATRTGVPATPGGSFRAAALAKVTFQVRANEQQGADNDTAIQPLPTGYTCQTDLFAQVQDQQAPYSTDLYVSPGIWQGRDDVMASAGDIASEFLPSTAYAAGHSYTHIFNRAVWGPGYSLPMVWQRQIQFDASDLITDPTPGMQNGVALTREALQLSRAGKVVKQTTLSSYGNSSSEFNVGINTAGWYRLIADATRYRPDVTSPAGTLTSRSTLDMHFYANPAKSQVVPIFLTRFTAYALNGSNHAAAGSVTPVGLTISRPPNGGGIPEPQDTAKTLLVWASADNGKTWQRVTGSKVNGLWVVNVHNPAAGQVSLRTEVADAAGNWTTETVYGAYGIG